MAGLAPAVAAVRAAVRAHLADLAPGGTVLIACSGGADSLALAAAARFVAGHQGVHCGLVTVDHGLQPGSAERAASVAKWAKAEGFAPVRVVTVEVSGPGGPEAAARDARYAALASAAGEQARAGEHAVAGERAVAGEHAVAVLLGHTREDQAETVLLALARGAGARGLAGMPERRVIDGVPFGRPLLDVSREQTRAACAAEGLEPWDDPHNRDPAYARARVRAALPVLIEALGPDVVTNLARTAKLLAADATALDEMAAGVASRAIESDGSLLLPVLAGLPDALRTRVLHAWAKRLGATGSALSYRHIEALDALVNRWHGQGPAALPGGIQVIRHGDRLRTENPRPKTNKDIDPSSR